MSFFEYLQADEARARRYKEAMGAMSSGEGFGFSHTVESYPWQSLGHGTVVDVSLFCKCVVHRGRLTNRR